MIKQVSALFLFGLVTSCLHVPIQAAGQAMQTICNPMDINYRFCLDKPSRREAADPTIINFKHAYYLFASKSGGYWYSNNLSDWNFVATTELPVEDYAPTVVAIDDVLYFLAGGNTIYQSVDVKAGQWKKAAVLPFSVSDPALFLDDDRRLYLYWGCSNREPTYGIELDIKNNLKPVGDRVGLIRATPREHGWEVPGDYNTKSENAPWIEGSWMNKIQGTYYLQYANPGTEFKSYSDGVYISDKPLGPYTLAIHNPFACKPEGFAAGAGHGSTFVDNYGNLWHIGTVTISVKHMFERRLGLYPVFLDSDGILYADTRFGDYPMIVPQRKIERFEDIFPGWMLLSYHKPVTVSSSLESNPSSFASDEDIRTYWAAQSGKDTEWAVMDLGGICAIHSVQINFAEHNCDIYGRQKDLKIQYVVEGSSDNKTWTVMIDKSNNQTDNSHDYTQMDTPFRGRYIRISHIKVPSGNVAISDIRLFGKGTGSAPAAINQWSVSRKPDNRRSVRLTWDQSTGATGYQIRYGISPMKLYQAYMVYQNSTVEINNLNTSQSYYFVIDTFNENGLTQGTETKKAE